MRDYWNDPPDEPEPPECPNCQDGFGDYLYDGENDKGEPVQVFSCDECGYQWNYLIPPDPDPLEDFDVEPPPAPEKCPHGNGWGECSACDHAGDLAYDAAREARLR
jgi:hypothetical protein